MANKKKSPTKKKSTAKKQSNKAPKMSEMDNMKAEIASELVQLRKVNS